MTRDASFGIIKIENMKKQANLRFLSEGAFKGLVKGLIKASAVYGTVVRDGFPVYARVSDPDELDLSMRPTALSAKEFLFPQRETLLRFDREAGTHEPVMEAADQVIIGLHPCDIHAISLMDRVFANGVPDANYLKRRGHTVIIGTECVPDDYCFCASVGTMTVEEGFDIFLHKIKNGYLARTATDRGKKLLAKASTRPATGKETAGLEGFLKKKESSFKVRLDAPKEDLPGIYARSDESGVWDKIGAICYGCGSCNNVCPTCYCFDVVDTVKADLIHGERVRVWDGCTLEDFAKVAGGHNFRKTRAERLRHRFNRKFRYLSDVFNALFCVGCGRCSRTCLVKINIAEVTNELIREQKGGR